MKNTKTLVLSTLLALVFSIAPLALAQAVDTTPPADIENAPVVVGVGNGQVKLQWDVATDNVGVTGYKVYYDTISLKGQNTSNTNEKKQYAHSLKVDNVNATIVTGLTNDTKYYFAVTALDAAGNESEYFSPEAEATPVLSGGDLTTSSNSNGNGGNTNTLLSSQNANTPSANGNMNGAPSSSLPEVTDFTVNENNNALVFNWTPATSSTVIDQMLYTSKDGGTTYDAGVHMGLNKTYTLTTYDPSTTYMFKLTTKDATGAESKGVTATITTGVSDTLPSTKDISNLVSKFERVLSKYTITLTWSLPVDLTDIVSQIVYQSMDGSVFHQLASLAPTVTTYQIKDLIPGKYFFKITTKDKAGKESKGVVKMVELPQSGPAVALALFVAAGTGWMLNRKKKTTKL